MQSDREKIARVIAPAAWAGGPIGYWTEATRKRSLAKADQIIALQAPVQGEVLALRAIKAVTATAKDGAAGLSRIMAITRAVGIVEPYSDLLTDPDVALIVERPRTEWAHLFSPDATGCAIPPAGWSCSRARGHSGPCAASPTPPADAVEAMRELDREHFARLHRLQHDGAPAAKPKLGGALTGWAADEITALRAILAANATLRETL